MLLSQFYPPVTGGEERHVQALGQTLTSRGHEVSVVTIATSGTAGIDIDGGVRVHRVRTSALRLPLMYSDPERPHAAPVPDPELALAIRRSVRTERPHIVHSHNWIANSALALSRSSTVGMVLTLHDYSHVCAIKRLVRDGRLCPGPSLGRCLGCASRHYGPVAGAFTALGTRAVRRPKERRMDNIIAVSWAVAVGNGLPTSGMPFKVIPNFISDEVWRSAGEAANTSTWPVGLPVEPFLLMVGDLSRDKGVPTLLDAYGRLVNPPPLVLMGRRCRDTPSALPRRVTVLADAPHDLVLAAFQRCLVAVAPSVWQDPCPTTVLEAMAAGRAVVASGVGGIVDMVVPGESGLLVPPGHPGELAGALQRLLQDAALRHRLGTAARQRAIRFTASEVVPGIEGLYRSILAAAAARAN
jgi:glycosyltransferase involved in cell wall biosynthesis